MTHQIIDQPTRNIMFKLLLITLCLSLSSTCFANDFLTKLEGKWVWHENSDFCQFTNTSIELIEEGKILQFRYAQVNEDTKKMEYSTDFYEILETGESSASLYLQGESRFTEEGKPYIWIIELFDDDTFLWKLNYWPKDIDNKGEKVWPYRRVRCN